ncbi:MAG: hypothetical protein GX025_10405 [Clostridiales bacterium]|nr:hypothetical protein [Clostridiales bacterium]
MSGDFGPYGKGLDGYVHYTQGRKIRGVFVMTKEVQVSNDFPIMDCLVLFDEQFSIADFSTALEKAKQLRRIYTQHPFKESLKEVA